MSIQILLEVIILIPIGVFIGFCIGYKCISSAMKKGKEDERKQKN